MENLLPQRRGSAGGFFEQLHSIRGRSIFTECSPGESWIPLVSVCSKSHVRCGRAVRNRLLSQLLRPSPRFAVVLLSALMPFADLQKFVRYLEQQGQLERVRREVDPELEVTEITQRVVREKGPALLFERPKGSSIPLVMNLFGTMDRVRAALGRDPAEIGHELIAAAQRINPPSLKGIWESRGLVKCTLLTHHMESTYATYQVIVV